MKRMGAGRVNDGALGSHPGSKEREDGLSGEKAEAKEVEEPKKAIAFFCTKIRFKMFHHKDFKY